jgi:hypothetical protein
MKHMQATDALSTDQRTQGSSDGLHFRKFRHAG